MGALKRNIRKNHKPYKSWYIESLFFFQLLSAPNEIVFNSKPGCHYTLIASNLDGHPKGNGNEVVHWIV